VTENRSLYVRVGWAKSAEGGRWPTGKSSKPEEREVVVPAEWWAIDPKRVSAHPTFCLIAAN
jgi:hypothetical protein